ncbi:MAG: MATE family efflux transporter [Clostridia bacterium]|nr:MATE family efflux transporter [Clostridia bacterium]
MTLAKRANLTTGPLYSAIVKFTIPLIIASLVQLLFNAVDIAVLGHMADTNAVASVGVTSAVTGLLINAFIGFSTGTNIILARFLGAKDQENVRKTVDTSVIAAGSIGLLLALLGLFISPALLRLVDCPAECREGAILYLRIYLLGTPAILVYNFGSAVIRVSGDTKRPLYYIISSGLLNVILNFLLCLILPQKVAAVAIATFSSQVLSALLVIIHLIRMEGPCRMNLRHMVFDLMTLRRIVRFGFPTAITNSLYSVPNLMIQSAINSFGPAAITGNTSAANLEGMLGCFHNGFSVACMTFVGQNLGAQRQDRVNKTILFCLLINVLIGSGLGVGSTVFGEPLLRLYIPNDPAAVAYGMVRMKHISLFLGVGALNALLASCMNAFGYPISQTICGLISILGLRIIWMTILYPLRPSIDMLYFCYTVSWCLQLILLTGAFCIVWRKYKKGTLHEI